MLRDSLTKPAASRDRAETVALGGLAFLAAQPEEIERFLRLSGLDVDTLRAKAADPELLRAVMEFILADDARVTGLCQDLDLEPRDLHAALQALGQA